MGSGDEIVDFVVTMFLLSCSNDKNINHRRQCLRDTKNIKRPRFFLHEENTGKINLDNFLIFC